ncbi:thermonuclease family protein [Listeria aquatica]|uniref:SPbeta phage DNA nuclease n=1 Tax=Listeria aquatica FSL S10-1188 TaxID=1265818 RepID=W7AMN7_9LIST|nr:thermonuclease family protein [Listeria aquatica]EUJ16519.1 SPbeta phage DNA nuclease [Listeria aquatica FSL S10-1188]
MKKRIKKWISLGLVLLIFGGYGLYEGGYVTDFFDKVPSIKKESQAKTTIQMPENVVPVKLDHVVDGDTVAITFEGDPTVKKVRLLLMDTPESVKPGTPAQPFAKEASNYMKKLVSGAKLTLEYDQGGATDKYGRVLAYLYADGKNVNELMIYEGYARVAYIYKPNTRYLKEFNRVQTEAKKEKRNIWSKEGYVTDKGFQN